MAKKPQHVTEFEISTEELANGQQGTLLALASIVPHPMNPRGDNLDIESMMSDYLRAGFFDDNYPLRVSLDEKPTVKGNVITPKGNARLLRGHRRLAAALQIVERATKTPTEIPKGQGGDGKDTWAQIAERLFPAGMIPVVYDVGLNDTDELKRLHDHDNKEKPLTAYEAIASALNLIDMYTEKQVAIILGRESRDRVQKAKRFRVLPKYAQEAMRTGKIKASALNKLHKAGNDDAGGARGEFVAGEAFKAGFEAEKKLVESGGADKLHFTSEQAKNHTIALVNECPPLEAIFKALRQGKEHAAAAIAAAQTLAKTLGIDPTQEPSDE